MACCSGANPSITVPCFSARGGRDSTPPRFPAPVCGPFPPMKLYAGHLPMRQPSAVFEGIRTERSDAHRPILGVRNVVVRDDILQLKSMDYEGDAPDTADRW